MKSAKTDVLEICKAVELACAKLYHHFADLFKAERENLLLWLNAALEEENHARLFTLVGKLQHDGVIEAIRIDAVEAEVTLQYVRSLIKQVKQDTPTMEQALLLAIDLEKKLDGFMTENVITFSDPSYNQLFLQITNADTKHLEALEKAYVRIGLKARG
jgi:rubrerythrin